MEKMKSKVYIKVDEQNRVLRCEGGYTMNNIDNVDKWILIDEGNGDRYNLCQNNYFSDGLYTDDYLCRYKWTGTEAVLRTEEELEQDRIPFQKQNRTARLKAELAAYDYIGVKIATGVATRDEYADQIAYCEMLRQEIRALQN